MKKYLPILLLYISTVSVSAQEVVKHFLEKFGKDENMEVVSISKKMIEMMETSASNDKEFTEAIKELDQINIVSSREKNESEEYYKTACELLSDKKGKGFVDLISLNDKKECLLVMVKESKGTVNELILVSKNDIGEFYLISLNGKIDLKTLTKYAERMNIGGLDQLKTLDKK